MIFLIFLFKIIILLIFLLKSLNCCSGEKQFTTTITTKTNLIKNNNIGLLELNSVEHKRWGIFNIGNPAKEFQLFFQLNSTEFWLIDKNATLGWKEEGREKERYNNNKSFSSKLLKEYYKEGNISGLLFTDIIKIANINIQNISFISAKNGFPEYLKFIDEIDGLFGLSPIKTNKLNLILNNYFKKPIITIYTKGVISGDSGDDVSVAMGSVTFGSENEKECISGSYKYSKLSENSNEWATDLNLIKIGNNKINFINNKTRNSNTKIPKLRIADGTLYMYAPKEQLDQIALKLGAINISKNVTDFYILPIKKCEEKKKMPNIILNVGNSKNKKINILLKPTQYMELHEEEHGDENITETCRLLFLPNEAIFGYNNNNIDWNMGELFMLDRCISINFNDNTIGFGDKIKNFNEEENEEEEEEKKEIDNIINNIF